MRMTEPVDFINQPLESYFVAARFSPAATKALRQIIVSAETAFGAAVFGMPGEALHITVLDWISPVTGYNGMPRNHIYEQLHGDFDRAMTNAVASLPPIRVMFNAVKASSNTIYVTGEDSGEFAALRQRFMQQVTLPKDTKSPPPIIHSSLARFVQAIDFDTVEAFIDGQRLAITETFSHFDLLHATVEPNLQFEVLKQYKLEG